MPQKHRETFRVAYLPVNQAWALVYGEALISIEDQTLWNRREDLIAACVRHSLKVDPHTGVIS